MFLALKLVWIGEDYSNLWEQEVNRKRNETVCVIDLAFYTIKHTLGHPLIIWKKGRILLDYSSIAVNLYSGEQLQKKKKPKQLFLWTQTFWWNLCKVLCMNPQDWYCLSLICASSQDCLQMHCVLWWKEASFWLKWNVCFIPLKGIDFYPVRRRRKFCSHLSIYLVLVDWAIPEMSGLPQSLCSNEFLQVHWWSLGIRERKERKTANR